MPRYSQRGSPHLLPPLTTTTNLVNCTGEWGGWESSCSTECGGGLQRRTFQVTTSAEYGGRGCPADHGAVEERPCNTDPCPGTMGPGSMVGLVMWLTLFSVLQCTASDNGARSPPVTIPFANNPGCTPSPRQQYLAASLARQPTHKLNGVHATRISAWRTARVSGATLTLARLYVQVERSRELLWWSSRLATTGFPASPQTMKKRLQPATRRRARSTARARSPPPRAA
jgi:hypothetical protein